MEWCARFGQAALKSGACGKSEVAFARVSPAGKRLLSIEAPSRNTGRAVSREAPKTTKALRAAAAGDRSGSARRTRSGRACQHRLQAGTRNSTKPGSKANTVGNKPVIRYNASMCAQATQEPLPNWSFNRTANGMAPWPRGSVVHHLPRGQGATPSSAG